MRFRVRGPAIGDAIEVTQSVQPNAAAPIPVRVPLPNAQPGLRLLSREHRLDLPETLLQLLEERHGIKTLADIRRRGGLSRIAELRALDLSAIPHLDALADLDRLSNDLKETTALLTQRYTGVATIADTPRREFIAAMSVAETGFSPRRATELHVAAKAQTALLDQMFLGGAIDVANGMRPSSGFGAGDSSPAEEHDHD